MRAGWIVPGVIMMLIMAVLLYVPLPAAYSSGSSSSQCAQGNINRQCYLVLPCPSILPTSSSQECLSGETPLSVSWSGGNATTWIELVRCHDPTCRDVNTTATLQPGTPHGWAAVATGPSGTLSIWVPTNDSMIVLTDSVTDIPVTVVLNSMPEFHDIWGVFALIGMLLTIVGLLLPRHPRKKRRLGRAPQEAQESAYIPEELPPEQPYDASLPEDYGPYAGSPKETPEESPPPQT